MNLRPYQRELISNIRNCKSRRVIAQSATGSGKTFIFSHIAKMAVEAGRRILILTDRIELMNQSSGALTHVDLPFEEIKQGEKLTHSSVHIAMVETLNSRVKRDLSYSILLGSKDLIIIDECHKSSFDKLFKHFAHDSWVIGFTATPLRLGKRSPLSGFYSHLVQGPQISELVESGYLAKAITYGQNMDLSTVRVRGEDYDPEDQRRVYSRLQNFEAMYQNWKDKAGSLKTLIFCANVKASKEVAERFRSHGERIEHLDGGMSKEERESFLDRFESGTTQILTSISILTTGFDAPDVRCVVLYRATLSLPLYLQMCGRGSRIAPSKSEFLILDFGNNVSRFGFWEQDRNWSLTEKEAKKLRKPGATPMKLCSKCEAMLPVSARICRFCGHEMTLSKMEAKYSELVKLGSREVAKKELTVRELEAYRQAKGYKQGWLFRQLRNRSQFVEYGNLMGYNKGWAFVQAKRYLK